jgi:hypothetical protein
MEDLSEVNDMNEEHNVEGQSSLNPPVVMAAGVHEVMALTADAGLFSFERTRQRAAA